MFLIFSDNTPHLLTAIYRCLALRARELLSLDMFRTHVACNNRREVEIARVEVGFLLGCHELLSIFGDVFEEVEAAFWEGHLGKG